jgi:hypothetical protein
MEAVRILERSRHTKEQWDKIYGPDVQYADRYFHSFQQSSDGGFIAAGSRNHLNGGDNKRLFVAEVTAA